jgi:hypothetical protein
MIRGAQDVLIRAAEKAGHSSPQSLRHYLALSRSEGLAAKMNNVELLRDLEIKVQIRKKQIAKIDKANDLFEAILNNISVEDELLIFLKNDLKKVRTSI